MAAELDRFRLRASCQHGDLQTAIPMLLQQGFRQPPGLRPKQQKIPVMIRRFRIGSGRFGGQKPHGGSRVLPQEGLQIVVEHHIQHIPVIQSRAPQGLIRNLKPQRSNQMEPCSGGRAGPGYISRVLMDLRQTNTMFNIVLPFPRSFIPVKFQFHCKPIHRKIQANNSIFSTVLRKFRIF